jgi:hypothetical protein
MGDGDEFGGIRFDERLPGGAGEGLREGFGAAGQTLPEGIEGGGAFAGREGGPGGKSVAGAPDGPADVLRGRGRGFPERLSGGRIPGRAGRRDHGRILAGEAVGREARLPFAIQICLTAFRRCRILVFRPAGLAAVRSSAPSYSSIQIGFRFIP